MPKVFIATSSFSEANLKKLNNYNNFTIEFNPLSKKLNQEEIIKHASDADAIIAGTENYSQDVLTKLNNLKVISRLGVGMDNIDLNYTDNNKIAVFKTQTTPAPAVAELALGLMIDVVRKVSYQNNLLKSGIWEKTRGNLLQQKTLGIIGLGEIGKNLVSLSKGFNFKILAFDNYHDDFFAKENKITYCDLNTLLSSSDIVSVHLNLTDKTRELLSEKNLKKLKQNSILINTSRGEIINEDILYDILINNRILGAGLDVFNNEPYVGPLAGLKNTVLTPHIGAYAKEIRIRMETEAFNNITKGLNFE